MLSHSPICYYSLHSVPLLPSADACHAHRDQVDVQNAENAHQHLVTGASLMMVPFSNIGNG